VLFNLFPLVTMAERTLRSGSDTSAT